MSKCLLREKHTSFLFRHACTHYVKDCRKRFNDATATHLNCPTVCKSVCIRTFRKIKTRFHAHFLCYREDCKEMGGD